MNTNPNEVTEFDDLLLRHGTTGAKQVWFTRKEVLAIAGEATQSGSAPSDAARLDWYAANSDRIMSVGKAWYGRKGHGLACFEGIISHDDQHAYKGRKGMELLQAAIAQPVPQGKVK